ncbi:hypothetical protein HZC34_00775 [Candidatus Saganbacteria bacterium]|nr:hypothetical protein [Candidatus Saganbacteria bacterium]
MKEGDIRIVRFDAKYVSVSGTKLLVEDAKGKRIVVVTPFIINKVIEAIKMMKKFHVSITARVEKLDPLTLQFLGVEL